MKTLGHIHTHIVKETNCVLVDIRLAFKYMDMEIFTHCPHPTIRPKTKICFSGLVTALEDEQLANNEVQRT